MFGIIHNIIDCFSHRSETLLRCACSCCRTWESIKTAIKSDAVEEMCAAQGIISVLYSWTENSANARSNRMFLRTSVHGVLRMSKYILTGSTKQASPFRFSCFYFWKRNTQFQYLVTPFNIQPFIVYLDGSYSTKCQVVHNVCTRLTLHLGSSAAFPDLVSQGSLSMSRAEPPAIAEIQSPAKIAVNHMNNSNHLNSRRVTMLWWKIWMP